MGLYGMRGNVSSKERGGMSAQIVPFDYSSSVGTIIFFRMVRKFAFSVFLIPILGLVAMLLLHLDHGVVKWILFGLVFGAFMVYINLRVSLPRIDWKMDHRVPLLVLRAFTDETLKSGPGGTPADFEVGSSAPNNFVWQVAMELWDIARVVLLQKEENTVTPVYGIMIDSSEDQWKKDFERAARGAWMILLFPSLSPGVVEEMRLLQQFNLLWKTVIFMPPASPNWFRIITSFQLHPDFSKSWEAVRSGLEKHGFHFPEYDKEGLLFIPDENFGISTKLPLRFNGHPWRRLKELLSSTAGRIGLLTDCLPVERSWEIE